MNSTPVVQLDLAKVFQSEAVKANSEPETTRRGRTERKTNREGGKGQTEANLQTNT